MNFPILYSFRRCPYAMRARMALDAAHIEVEHREVLLRDKPAEMLAASPKGTVPVLVVKEGSVIDESLDIMVWALEQSDPEDWLKTKQADLADARTFLKAFKDRLDRYKYASRYDSSLDRGTVDLEQRSLAMSALQKLAAPLDQSPYLRGGRPHLLDIATFPFVRQFAAVEPDWWSSAASEGLQRWLSTWLESDRFERIMKKHPLWKSEIS